MKLSSKDIAITALFVAIIVVMTLTPLGMIPLPMVSINLVLIPIIVCSQLKNIKIAFLVSTAFGLCSFANAYLKPNWLYFAIQNPLVSVVPRMFIGIVAFAVYHGLKKLMDKKDDNSKSLGFGNRYFGNLLPSTLSALAGVVTNTVLFLGSMWLLYSGKTTPNGVVGFELIMSIVGLNTLVELIVTALVVPLVVSSLEKALR